MSSSLQHQPASIEPSVRNCRFKYECDMNWGDMKETSRSNVRLCETCSKEVHFVRNRVELALAIQNGLCVCVPHNIFDKQEPSPIQTTPKVIQDPKNQNQTYEVIMGRNLDALPSKGRDPSDIPAWLRKQMD